MAVQNNTLEEWRGGWQIVLAAALGAAGMSLPAGSFGAFMTPLANDLGWSRGMISGALVFLGLNQVFLNPIVGRWIDRFGSRKVALYGMVPYAAVIASLGLISAIWTWYLGWFALGLLFPIIGPLVWAAAVVRHFAASRGLALGVMMCGNGLGIALAPALAVALQTALGWRGAYAAIGTISLCLMLPLTWLLLPRDGARAIGTERSSEAWSGRHPFSEMAAVARNPQFWKLALPLALGGTVVSILLVHMQPLFIDAGATAGEAAAMMVVLAPTIVLGRLFIGFLLDHIFGPYVAAVALAMPVCSLVALYAYDGSMVTGIIAVAVLGFSFGAELDLLSYLTSRYFDMRSYATTYGYMLSVYSVLYTSAPMAAGSVYDFFGNYQALIPALIFLSIVSAVTIATLGPYQQRLPGEQEIGPVIQ